MAGGSALCGVQWRSPDGGLGDKAPRKFQQNEAILKHFPDTWAMEQIIVALQTLIPSRKLYHIIHFEFKALEISILYFSDVVFFY